MRFLLFGLLAVGLQAASPVVSSVVAAEEPAAETAGERLTSSQKRAIRSLAIKFRRARRNVDEQAAILSAAMQAGPQAVEEIRSMIEDQLTPAVSRYRQSFVKAASGAAAQKFAKADKNELQQIQNQVNALRSDPNLSKEMVKRIGDPGMERLAEIALLDRAGVLSTNRKLAEERQRLVPTGKLWEVATGYLAKAGSATASATDADSRATTFEEFLVQEEELAVMLALPMDDATRAIFRANDKLAKKLDPEEAKCVLSLNLTRILLGLKPLLIDLKLTAAARDHSADMRKLKFFDHKSPVKGKTTFSDRANNFGTSASGENIAAGYATGPAVNLGWFHSPGHHKNMLSGHDRVGIGRDGKHWTELFGRGFEGRN